MATTIWGRTSPFERPGGAVALLGVEGGEVDRRRQAGGEAGEGGDRLGGDGVRLLRHRRGAAAGAGAGLAAFAAAHQDEVAGHLAEGAGQGGAPAGEGAEGAAVCVPGA